MNGCLQRVNEQRTLAGMRGRTSDLALLRQYIVRAGTITMPAPIRYIARLQLALLFACALVRFRAERFESVQPPAGSQIPAKRRFYVLQQVLRFAGRGRQ